MVDVSEFIQNDEFSMDIQVSEEIKIEIYRGSHIRLINLVPNIAHITVTWQNSEMAPVFRTEILRWRKIRKIQNLEMNFFSNSEPSQNFRSEKVSHFGIFLRDDICFWLWEGILSNRELWNCSKFRFSKFLNFASSQSRVHMSCCVKDLLRECWILNKEPTIIWT